MFFSFVVTPKPVRLKCNFLFLLFNTLYQWPKSVARHGKYIYSVGSKKWLKILKCFLNYLQVWLSIHQIQSNKKEFLCENCKEQLITWISMSN